LIVRTTRFARSSQVGELALKSAGEVNVCGRA
jgi:hypothetical protein